MCSCPLVRLLFVLASFLPLYYLFIVALRASRACGSLAVVRPPEQESQACIGRPSHALGRTPPGSPCADEFVHSCSAILHCHTGHRGLIEVDDRRTRRFQAPHMWDCLTVQGDALRALVSLRPLSGPSTHRVAAKRAGEPGDSFHCNPYIFQRVPSDRVASTLLALRPTCTYTVTGNVNIVLIPSRTMSKTCSKHQLFK